MTQIAKITPIDASTTKSNVQEKVHDFLKTILSNNILFQSEIESVTDKYSKGDRLFRVLTTKTNEQYVIGDKGIERLVGSKYLENVLKDLDLNWTSVKTKVVPTKTISETNQFQITIKQNKNLMQLYSNDFIPISEYVGEEKPTDIFEAKEKVESVSGFFDMAFGVNLRYQNGKVIVIDTEYSSFEGVSEATCFDELQDLTLTFKLSDFI